MKPDTSRLDRPGELYQALRVMFASVIALQGRNARRLGLTRMEIDALLVLGVAPTGSTGLAARLGISQPAASDVLRRLAERGLVERFRDPSDGRLRLARPSADAYAAVFGEIMSLMVDVDAIAMSLGSSDREVVERFLGDVVVAIENLLAHDELRDDPAASFESADAPRGRER